MDEVAEGGGVAGLVLVVYYFFYPPDLEGVYLAGAVPFVEVSEVFGQFF